MQREILFRGKRIDNGEWVYGGILPDNAACSLKAEKKCVCKHDGSDVYIFAWNQMCHEYESFEVDPETVGQYTGLKDKKGVKAFRDDMVHKIYSDGWDTAFSIEWDDELLAWVANNGISEPELLRNVWNDTCEIIGNIHDKENS